MRVKRSLHAWHQPVYPRMNIERSRFRLALTVDNMSVEIANQKSRRGDFGERVAIRIHEKQIVVARDNGREVIANPFLQAMPRGELKTGGQFDTGLHHCVCIESHVA